MSNPFTHNEYRAAVLRINQQLLELELSGPIANESPAQKARLDTIEQEVIALNDEIDQMQAAFRWIDTGVSNPETGAPVFRAIAPSCHNPKQLGTKFVDRRRQHALGLDARLARRVEPQQVHHDVANDGEIVGSVAGANA